MSEPICLEACNQSEILLKEIYLVSKQSPVTTFPFLIIVCLLIIHLLQISCISSLTVLQAVRSSPLLTSFLSWYTFCSVVFCQDHLTQCVAFCLESFLQGIFPICFHVCLPIEHFPSAVSHLSLFG